MQVEIKVDQSVNRVEDSASLLGYSLDDVAVTSSSWSQLSGPGTGVVTFSNPDSLSTTVSANVAGMYLLQLEVSDGQYKATDTIEFHVAKGCNTPVLSGTTHWWSFNSHARDLIGGIDGYWHGLENYEEGFAGTSYKGQATTDVIELENEGDSLNLMKNSIDENWTMEFWVKYESSGRVMQNTSIRMWHRYLNGSTIRNSVYTTNFAFDDEEWHHVSYKYDNGLLSCHIDGSFINSIQRVMSNTGFDEEVFLTV